VIFITRTFTYCKCLLLNADLYVSVEEATCPNGYACYVLGTTELHKNSSHMGSTPTLLWEMDSETSNVRWTLEENGNSCCVWGGCEVRN